MRLGMGAVALAALSVGCETEGPMVGDDRGVFARGDTADTGLFLEPQCAEPGVCGCDFTGLDLDANGTDETCIHDTAIIEGTVGIGARVESGAEVRSNATLGAGATLGVNSIVAERATIGEDAVIGDGVIIGRRAQIGARAQIGDDSSIGRAAVVGDDVDASIGRLNMGYASGLGARSLVTGFDVTFGNLAQVGADSTIAGEVILARGANFGDNTVLGEGVIIGPEVSALNGAQIGAGTRIRKGVTLGGEVTVGGDVRIGRDTELRDGSVVGDNAVVRAAVTVGTFVRVEDDTYIPRGTVLEDQSGGLPFVVDEPPVIVITSPLDGVDSDGGSVTVTGTVSDDFGVASVTLQVDNGTPVSVPVSGGTFSYTVTGIADQSGSIIARAFDTAGQTATDEVRLSDCNVSGVTHEWTGAVSSDWHTAGNWSAGSVPTTSSRVFVCGGNPNPPTLAQNVSVQRIMLDWDAELVTEGFSLTVSDGFYGGRATGTGLVAVTGGGLRGEVPYLRTTGSVTAAGSVHVTRDASIASGSYLYLYQAPVVVDGNLSNFVWTSTGGLNMQSPLARIEVGGIATFTGNTNQSTSVLNQGVIVLRGAMNAPCSTSYDCLAMGGTVLEFAGTEPQSVTINAGGTGYNRMSDIVVRNPAGVDFTANNGTVTSVGTLSVLDGGVMTTNGFTATGGSGTSVFSGSAQLLASTGQISIASNIDVRDTSTLDVNVLVASRELVMSEGSHLHATRVDMSTALPYTSADYTALNTRLLGVVTVSENRLLRMPKLTLPSGAGTLHVGAVTVDLTGDYEQFVSTSTTGLNLTSVSSRFEIGGAATFNGNTNLSTSMFNQGVVTIGGNFSAPCSTSYDCLTSVGTSWEFDGSAPQTANFAASGTGYNRIGSVVVRNPTGVTFTADFGTPTAMGTLSVDGGVMTANGFLAHGAGGTSVYANGGVLQAQSGQITINSNIEVLDTATIDVHNLYAGGTLVMSETSHLDANRVDMASALPVTSADYTATDTRLLGVVTVSEDRVLRMPKLILPSGAGTLHVAAATVELTGDYEQFISTSSTGLSMTNPAARFEIGGAATFNGNTNQSTSMLNQGVITIAGDFSAPCSTSYDCVASVGSTWEFDGSSAQDANFAASGTGYNRIGSVVVRNPAGVTFSADWGTATGMGTVSVRDGGRMIANGFLAHQASGTSIFAEGGTLEAESGQITINSSVQVDDTATIDVHNLYVQGELVMSEESHLHANRVDMASALPYTSADYTALDTRLLGVVTEDQSRVLRMPKLTLPTGAGTLHIGAATIALTGDYEQFVSTSTTGLSFTNPSARFEVGGGAVFNGNTNLSTSMFNQGVITVGGDFSAPCSTSYDCLTATETVFEFDGSSPQAVSFAASGTGYNRIGHIVVRNPAGVSFTSAIGTTTAMGTVSVLDGGRMIANGLQSEATTGTSVIAGNSTLEASSGQITINSDIDVQDTSTIGVYNLSAARALTMSPTSHLAANRVDMSSALPVTSDDYTALDTRLLGAATLSEDRVLQMPQLTVTGATGRIDLYARLEVTGDYVQFIGGSDAGTNMRSAAAHLVVGGDATFNGNTNLSTATFNQGAVSLAGSMSAPCSTSYDCLTGSGTVWTFDGATPQSVSFAAAGSGYNRMGPVVIDTGADVSITSNWYAEGDLDILGTLTVAAGTTSTLTNDVNIAAGGVLNNNGTVRYNNAYTNNGTLNGNLPQVY